MMPVLCNGSPISQKGGVAVLCPVAVLGTFPYVCVCVCVCVCACVRACMHVCYCMYKISAKGIICKFVARMLPLPNATKIVELLIVFIFSDGKIH